MNGLTKQCPICPSQTKRLSVHLRTVHNLAHDVTERNILAWVEEYRRNNPVPEPAPEPEPEPEPAVQPFATDHFFEFAKHILDKAKMWNTIITYYDIEGEDKEIFMDLWEVRDWSQLQEIIAEECGYSEETSEFVLFPPNIERSVFIDGIYECNPPQPCTFSDAVSFAYFFLTSSVALVTRCTGYFIKHCSVGRISWGSEQVKKLVENLNRKTISVIDAKGKRKVVKFGHFLEIPEITQAFKTYEREDRRLFD
jgi:hypothetical protein